MGSTFSRKSIPHNHPLGRYFRDVVDSSFEAVGYYDHDVAQYVWKLLLRFVLIENLYVNGPRSGVRLEQAIDFLLEEQILDRTSLREFTKHKGDFCLFFTGLYPENLEYKGRNPEFYISQGKAAYSCVADMDSLCPSGQFFRKLTEAFENCVQAMRMGREFMTDSVYQLIGRQFEA